MGSRLNYNKWDKLELSDDSDIETHPNIDKKSMIRWKQRDIHEKREIRKQKIMHLGLEYKMNEGLLVRVEELLKATKSEGQAFVSREVGRLKAAVPDYEKPLERGVQPSEDHMILSLLSQVVNAVESGDKPKPADDKARNERLLEELEGHKKKLLDRQVDVLKEEAQEKEEMKKHITSEDMKMGWDSKTMISNTPSAAPVESKKPEPKKETKKKETVIETLNAPAASSSSAPQIKAADSDDEGTDSDADVDVPTLTPVAATFSSISPQDFESSFRAISAHPRELLQDTVVDAILVDAFEVAMKAKGKKGAERIARGKVHQALMIQYCMKLGKDGVALFFKRMTGGNPAALKLFLDDVEATATRIVNRAAAVAKDQDNQVERETIQLYATDPNVVISFEVPEGPPPETIEITGEGSEAYDPAAVREFLQTRWDTFQAFPPGLQKALADKSLEKVNKVLAKMSVEDAEEVVGKLQEAGIMSFEEKGVIDGTKVGKDEAIREVEERKKAQQQADPSTQAPALAEEVVAEVD